MLSAQKGILHGRPAAEGVRVTPWPLSLPPDPIPGKLRLNRLPKVVTRYFTMFFFYLGKRMATKIATFTYVLSEAEQRCPCTVFRMMDPTLSQQNRCLPLLKSA